MKKYENECVGCPPEMGCLGNSCPNRRVLHLYCDKCKEDADELYETESGAELCIACYVELCQHKEGVCEECGDECDIYEAPDGKFLCECCMEQILEKVG